MTNTNTNGCALHNTTLPNLRVFRQGMFDQVGAGHVPGGVRVPTEFTVVVIGSRAYGIWRTADYQPHLVLDERRNRSAEWRDVEPVNILIAQQGQKFRISQDYWVLDTSQGAPRFVAC